MRPRTALLHGFLIWCITLAISSAVFALRTSNRPLFESIMPVVLAACIVLLVQLYHRKRPEAPPREWRSVGLLWLVMNWLLDAPLFSGGHMKMSLAEYFSDVSITYLLIPVNVLGASRLLRAAKPPATSQCNVT